MIHELRTKPTKQMVVVQTDADFCCLLGATLSNESCLDTKVADSGDIFATGEDIGESQLLGEIRPSPYAMVDFDGVLVLIGAGQERRLTRTMVV